MPMPVDITPSDLDGVLEINVGLFSDQRGFFTELYNRDEWVAKGFTAEFVQNNLSQSSKGILRGMHYQIEPHAMGKLVRTIQGSVYDVAVDLRKGSPTFGKWMGRVLDDQHHLALWIPAGFAHGFVALEDHSLVYYGCSATHHAESERSLAYNDPEVDIQWPIEPTVVSDKDRNAPTLAEAEYNFTYEG
jgi:dTDP-4-dehydrorhamnose 3,5-epimerase